MFERFTDRARHVIVLAQEEARLLSHNYVGTEHLLLGLLREGKSNATKALVSLGVSHEAARAQVEAMVGPSKFAPSGHIPFSPRSKKVLELVIREAVRLGHSYIGPEHLLLSLLHEGEGVAIRVLVALDVDLSALRQETLNLMGAGATPPAKKRLTIDFAAIGLGQELDTVIAVRERLGSSHPAYLLAVANIFDLAAQLLREKSQAGEAD